MMRLTKFKYLAPTKLSEAVKILADEGASATVVAGGTDLYPNMKRRHQTPATLVGLRKVKELQGIKGKPEKGLRLGPMTTLTEICTSPVIKANYPSLAKAVSMISTPILRNMGTIGGNICLDTRCNYYNQNYEWRRGINFCMKRKEDNPKAPCWVALSSPKCLAINSSDTAGLMCAIGAKFRLVSKKGERLVAAKDFYNNDGIKYLNKKPDEVLADIHLPAINGWRATYIKLRRREAFDFPVLGVSVALWQNNGIVEDAKIFVNSVASSPLEAKEAEKIIVGRKLTEENIHNASEESYKLAKPMDNTDFSMYWRKDMVRVFVQRALNELGYES